MQTVFALMRVQNEIVYALESLANNFGGEMKDAVRDAARAAEAEGVPGHVRVPVVESCNQARKAWVADGRHPRECPTILSTVRRRLANEVAYRLGDDLPYPASSYPLYYPASDA